jgi:hypothetical protein
MSTSISIQGRQLFADDISLVRHLMAQHPAWSMSPIWPVSSWALVSGACDPTDPCAMAMTCAWWKPSWIARFQQQADVNQTAGTGQAV